MNRFRWVAWFIGGGAVVYVLALGFFYLFQDKFIFQGTPLTSDYQFRFDQPFEEHFIKVSDHDSLHAILFKTERPAKGLILYFHGNADNLQRWGQFAVDFTALDYDVLMVDYRGYGKSSGKPNEEILYQDSEEVLRWAQDNIPHFKLVLYGRSLGAAAASHLANKSRAALVILETPFDELRGALYGFPTRYRFSNKENIPGINSKVVIMHGTRDLVVPLKSALKLKPLLKQNDLFIIVEGAGHHNLRDYTAYRTALAEALQ